jgi:multiple sugar transport system permease protein
MSQGISTTAVARRGLARRHWRMAEYPYIWVTPLVILLLLTYVYPAFEVIRFSFTDATLLNPTYEYTLEGYEALGRNANLRGILWITFVFVVASVVFQLLLGLLVALALARGAKRNLPGVSVVRIIILASWIVPGVAAGIVWQLIFSEASYGLFNSILRDLGLRPVQWLSNPNLALWSAIIANIWRGTAFSMILLYAGILVIPQSLYEAADVDGANSWRKFWYITLPQLRPIMLINTILISIFTLNTFDMILALTGGGPGRATEVLALYAYNIVFRNFDLSNGSVIAVLLLAISVAFTFFYVRLLPKENE